MTPYDLVVFAGVVIAIGLVLYALRLPLARLIGRGQRSLGDAARETRDEYYHAAQDANSTEGVTPHDENHHEQR